MATAGTELASSIDDRLIACVFIQLVLMDFYSCKAIKIGMLSSIAWLELEIYECTLYFYVLGD